MEYVFDIHETMLDQKLTLVYKGNFQQEITNSLLALTEREIMLSGDEPVIMRRIINVMVECLQNISKHAAKPEDLLTTKPSIFTIGRDEECYCIATGNLMVTDQMKLLNERLDNINKSGYDELKDLYIKAMTASKMSKHGDACLGLINLARKSKEKLLFYFEPVNDEFSFYSFQINIKHEKSTIASKSKNPSEMVVAANNKDIKKLHAVHDKMLKENLILVYEGEFTQKITTSLLKMIERKIEISGERSDIKRKIFNVMTESLQNICSYAKQDHEFTNHNTSVFMIGRNDTDYFISTGNIIRSNDIEPLKKRLDQINELDRGGLKHLYMQMIKKDIDPDTKSTGLGLIDMAKKSGQKLKYDFKNLEGNLGFYSLQVKIPVQN